MNRRKFISNCSLACLGTLTITPLLTGCSTSKILSGEIIESEIIIDLKEFEIFKNEKKNFEKKVIIQNKNLKYPIMVTRLNEMEYFAIYLQCTHQGVELQVLGDTLFCSAHGSEFSNKGIVEVGPAETNLRIFPVKIESKKLKISLK